MGFSFSVLLNPLDLIIKRHYDGFKTKILERTQFNSARLFSIFVLLFFCFPSTKHTHCIYPNRTDFRMGNTVHCWFSLSMSLCSYKEIDGRSVFILLFLRKSYTFSLLWPDNDDAWFYSSPRSKQCIQIWEINQIKLHTERSKLRANSCFCCNKTQSANNCW